MLLLLLLEHYVCTKISNNICIDSLHFETIIRIWGRIRYHLLSSVPTKSHSYRNNWNDHYWNYTRATNNFGNFHNTSTFPKLAKFSFIPSITVTTIEPMNELLLGMTKKWNSHNPFFKNLHLLLLLIFLCYKNVIYARTICTKGFTFLLLVCIESVYTIVCCSVFTAISSVKVLPYSQVVTTITSVFSTWDLRHVSFLNLYAFWSMWT
mgnify:CR=1 FL=1